MNTYLDVTDDLLMAVWKLQCNKFGCVFEADVAQEVNAFVKQVILEYLMNKHIAGLGDEMDLDIAIKGAREAMYQRFDK